MARCLCCPSGPRLCSRSSAYTLALGLGFVTLGTSRILLLKFSANAENKYDFLPASVNLLAELLKLLFCLVMSVRVIVREGRSCRELGCGSSSSFLSSLKWSVPAFLYFLDNLIIFYVMSYLQPAMAVLFSNFVILTTAVLFRIVLKRRLSWVQWAALVVLFLAIVSLTTGSGGHQNSIAVPGLHSNPLSTPSNSCLLYTQLLEQMRNSSESWTSSLPGEAWRESVVEKLRSLGVGHILLLLQCFISAMANIYNEKILKEGDQLTESIFIQNSKLYAFGVVFNGLTLGFSREARGLTVHCGLLHGHNVYSLGLVLVTDVRGFSKEATQLFKWANAAPLQMELVDLQADVALKEQFRGADPATFWFQMVSESAFLGLRKVALYIMTMFGSTYSCEAAFSTMNIIKTKYRSRLTNEHLQMCMRMALTPFKPRFKILAGKATAQFSH